jgi:hypothetical protein
MRAWLVLAVCLVLALGGCGGGDDSASTSSTTQEATTANTPQPSQQSTSTTGQGQDKSKQDKNSTAAKGENSQQQSSSNPPKHLKLVRVPPISSAPKAGSKHPAPGVATVKGGDNSVQEYGVETDESSRREAAIALATYLSARGEEDWGAACSLLALRPTEQLEKLAGDKADCAEVLAETAKGTSSQPGSSITEVLSFRGEGDISGNPSYLIFTGPPGQTLFSMPMYLQGGAWKVGLAQPSELPV